MHPPRNILSCMKRQPSKSKKLIIGLTGSFGSGKSTVCRMLKSYGAEIIDADKIAHQLLQPASPVYKKVVRAFDNNILRGKNIDRAKLAGLVFGNIHCLRKLNSIVHPPIISLIKNKIRRLRHKTIVIDAPLLIEAGLAPLAKNLVVVTVSTGEQLKRLLKKTGFKKKDILKRIKAQMPLKNKVRLADFVIDNSGTKAQTRRQVQDLWKTIGGCSG